MITKVRLKNFKLHEDTTIEGLPITMFIGPNNSGKSSIFQALISLRQAGAMGGNQFFYSFQREATKPYVLPENAIIDLAKFQNVVRHGNDVIFLGLEGKADFREIGQGLNNIALKLETTPNTWSSIGQTDLVLKEAELKSEFGIKGNQLSYTKGSLQAGPIWINWEYYFSKGQAATATVSPHSISIDDFKLGFSTTGLFSPQLQLPGIRAPSDAPPESRFVIDKFARSLANLPQHLVTSVHPISALRGFEEWAYPFPSSPPQNLERVLLADRSVALASILPYDRNMEDRLNEWLQDVIQVGIRFHHVGGHRVIIRSQAPDYETSETLFINKGSGANQLPFILVPIALTPIGETLLISEPEAHLHPKAQANLVGLLLRIFRKESRQFFFETHSEHILHSFLYAIAKGELTKEQLAIYYFENEQGTARVRRLEIDDQGRVKGGLPGFFEHSLQELSESLESLKNV